MFKNITSFILQTINSVFYVEGNYMDSNRDEYVLHAQRIENRIKNTHELLQEHIERHCRTGNYLEIINSMGFEETSAVLFEGSWQEKVVNLLEMDGFLCSMTFDYKNGVNKNTLKISWEV